VLGRPVAVVAHTTAALVTLPGRVIGLMTLAEQTLSAMHTTVTRTDALLDRVETLTCTAEGVVHAAGRAVPAAAGAIEEARVLTARAAPLLEGYSEPLRRLEPMVRRLAEAAQQDGIDALVTLLDRLPQLADAMDHEVIPLLAHLDQVGPDVNQLLDRVFLLNHMTSRLPTVFRRRNHP
jgi:ABC-type transporter Mla subunit MlaD